jgi:hypothetical protein
MGRTSKRAKELQKRYLANLEKKEYEKSNVHSEDKHYTQKDRLKHQSWCLQNDIIIYFLPLNWREGQIVVEQNGDPIVKPEIYYQKKLKPTDVRYHEVIWKLYTKFYEESRQSIQRKS